ncbi:hypothetical protein MY04_4676 [Flammeovirga sp. MY04]|uniref:MGH1-like glycoside hydrolase domain-containing protein n=1 Tax=Flammeovirga sp. MY04 TaxID=1191459 RepID=UPI0008260077|nr:trehalase family glycosidase [Flammeovirga sp. MY04]ANQ52011.2 hypothetical protein MY04_4676 [Flammeovirga sp. MY04]
MKQIVFFLCWIIIAQNLWAQDRTAEFQSKISKGWNTWNYYSMLSYVELPSGLSININLRPSVQGTPYDPNYFFDNIQVDKEGKIRPVAHTFDGSYTHVNVDDWKGNKLSIKSAVVDDNIYILVEPIKTSTPYFCEIETGFLWNNRGQLSYLQDKIEAKTEQTTKEIRSTMSDQKIARPYKAPYYSISSDSDFAIYTGGVLSLAKIKKIISNAENNYLSASKSYGDLAEGYLATQSVLGWNTLYDADKDRVISPVSRGWNEAWQGFVLFEWDTYFAALLQGLGNKEYAYSNALTMSKAVNRHGAIAFTQQPRGQLADNSQPPVGSMVCWLLYEKYQEKWFLEEVYDGLLSWNKWWVKNRNNKGYLTWGASWKGARVQDAAWESGLDNSPMYEDVAIETVGENSLLNIADVGLNSMYVMDCQYLSKIAEVLGKTDDLKYLKEREKQFTKQVQSLWDEEKGIYQNKYLSDDTFCNRLTPTSFYPMIANIPSKKQAKRLLEEHYYNEEEFYGKYIIPSCARNDKSYDNKYWRGAIWGPMNFLVYLGLRNYDQKASKDMADKSYQLFMDAWMNHKYVFENIHSEKGVQDPKDQLDCDPYYHWGALMGLMKFMEEGQYKKKQL